MRSINPKATPIQIEDIRTSPPNHPVQYNKNDPTAYLIYFIMSKTQMYKYYVSRNKKRSIDKTITKVNR